MKNIIQRNLIFNLYDMACIFFAKNFMSFRFPPFSASLKITTTRKHFFKLSEAFPIYRQQLQQAHTHTVAKFKFQHENTKHHSNFEHETCKFVFFFSSRCFLSFTCNGGNKMGKSSKLKFYGGEVNR